jgi:hypothetical protein
MVCYMVQSDVACKSPVTDVNVILVEVKPLSCLASERALRIIFLLGHREPV